MALTIRKIPKMRIATQIQSSFVIMLFLLSAGGAPCSPQARAYAFPMSLRFFSRYSQ